MMIEKAATQENSEEEIDQVSSEDIIKLIEKSFMLLGQVNNKAVNCRHLNILNVSLNSKSDAKGALNSHTPLLSTNSTEIFGRQFWKQVLDNIKAQKETLEMIREVGKTQKKPFLAGCPARNKQSPRESAGNHNRIPLCQHFGKQQQQRWQRNTTIQTANKSNGKTPKTSASYLLQHFSRSSSIRKIRTRSSFNKGNNRGGIKTKCSSRRKDFPFRRILGRAHKRSRHFRDSGGIRNSLVKDTSSGKNSSKYTPKRKSEISIGKRDERNLGEGSNKESLATRRSACSKSISEQSFSCKE